jgi:hypothetical protein
VSFRGLNIGAVGEEDVQIAVVVIVKDRYAPAMVSGA